MFKHRYAAAVLVGLLLAGLSSCFSGAKLELTLDQTPVISGGLGWGVVALSYAKLLLEPSSTALAAGSVRRNEVGKVVARSRIFEGRDAGIWYKLEMGSAVGWLHEAAVEIHRSEAEARKAAESGS
jgi:hypothetical protein